MNEQRDELASYLPSFLVSALEAETELRPREERRFGAVLFADISGFTPLTERLAQQGPDGAEALSRILNLYFGALIESISSHGGEILRFAGDAPLVLWFARSEAEQSEAVLRASQCALELKEKLNEYKVAGLATLSLRIGIGAGELSCYWIGGREERWELLVAGAPLTQVAAAERSAKPGEVVLSSEAAALLEGARGERFAGEDQECLRLEALSEGIALSAQQRQRPAEASLLRLRAFIPRPALARIDAGLSGSFAELRRVSVLFLQISGLLSAPHDRLEPLQEAFGVIQEEVYKYGGSINQFLVDDKGTTLVAVWGLPTRTHEDNAARALQTALSLQHWFAARGMGAAFGVSSSRVFAGDRGARSRREYAVIGKGVNLAARLMQAAYPASILCDETSAQESSRKVQCLERPRLPLKGWSAPVPVFHPTQLKARNTAQPRASMIGRQRELALLEEALTRLRDGVGSFFCLEGEAGIGKTQLVGAFLAQAQQEVVCLLGAGDSIEHSTPYFAWRQVLTRLLLRNDAEPRPELLRGRLLAMFQEDASALELLPLLNSIIPLELPETARTTQMDKQVRSDNTHRLVSALLQRASVSAPLVLILDDIQWLDTASLELARLVSRDVSRLCLVLVTRPMLEQAPLSYQQLVAQPGMLRLLLETLSREEVAALVMRRLGAEKISQEVEALLYEKTKGHPFFSEELAFAMRDLGLLVVVQGELCLAPNISPERLQFPETLNGVIASRIDRLTLPQQLLLKAASVIGRVFSRRALLEIQPVDTEEDAVVQELEALQRLDLTSLETPEPEIAYLFKHILTQEVAYNLMLFSQRRALHRSVAEWYERAHKDDLSPYFALLAHHWQKAEEPTRALDYTEKAGEQALRSFANEEAVRFFREALKMAQKLKIPEARRERWERQLGEAFYGMGRLAESREHLLRALSLLHTPMPSKPQRFALDLGLQMLKQAAQRFSPPQINEAQREALLEAARVYETLALTYYFGDKTLGAVYSTLQNMNLSEQAGPSPELARAYAASCMAAGLVPLHALAMIYERRAKETAQAGHDPRTLAWVLQATGVYRAGRGEWPQAKQDLEAAYSQYERLGDRRGCDQEKAILAWVHNAEGDFAKSTRLYAETYHSAKKRDDPQAQNWGLCGQAENALHRRDLPIEQVVDFMEEARSLLVKDLGRPEEVRVFGLLAMARYHQGEHALAREAAVEGSRRVSLLAPPTSFYSLEGYAGLAESLLLLWRDEPQAKAAALSACRGVAAYARVFPAGEPRAELLWGMYEWHRQNKRRALRHWERSAAAAKRLNMPLEEARASAQLATHSASSAHQQKASTLFRRLGINP